MYCPKCGNQVPDGSAFCHLCGTGLTRRGGSLRERRLEKIDRIVERVSSQPQSSGHASPRNAGASRTVEPEEQRPPAITLLAILCWVFGLLFAMPGLFLALDAASSEDSILADTGLREWAVASGIFLVVLGLSLCAIGRGLWNLSAWAWWGILAVLCLAVVASLVSLADGDLGGLVGLGISGIIVVYLLSGPVRGAFMIDGGRESAGLAASAGPPYYPTRRASAQTGPNMRAGPERHTFRVRVSGVPLRGSPTIDSRVLLDLTLNEEVALIEREGPFLLVETAGGRRGYVSIEAVQSGSAGPSG